MSSESNTIAVATRLSLDTLAKAYGILVKRGIQIDQLASVSQIIRLAIFASILDNTNDPTSPPTEEDLKAVSSLIKSKSKK